MNTLNMPGFTAETSLYKNRTSYRMMADGNGNDSSGVIPQKWFRCTAAIVGAAATCSAAVTGVGIAACAAACAGAAAVCDD